MTFRKVHRFGQKSYDSRLNCIPDDSDLYYVSKRSYVVKKFVIDPLGRNHFYESIRQQPFPFRNPLIDYITKNPLSPNFYQKLIKTCKYFFDKNPILIFTDISFKYDNSGWHICWKEMDLDSKKFLCKFWITNEIFIVYKSEEESDDQHLDECIIPKIYQNDAREFAVINQNISFKNFIYFAFKCHYILLEKVTVKNIDGSILSLEELVENLPNIEKFQYTLPNINSSIITNETVNKLLKIRHFSNVKKFCLYEIPEIFDIDNFYEYIKKNVNTEFFLHFCNKISEEFKNRIRTIEEDIRNAKYRYKSIYIGFR